MSYALGHVWEQVRTMRKIKEMLSAAIPKTSVFPLALALSVNMAVYCGSRVVAGGWRHYNIECGLDRMIPFFPPSVVIYLGCYLFWAANYILIARQGKEDVCRFFSADLLSRVVCLIFFLAFPTTNVRPQVAPDGFFNRVMAIVYRADAADNLFPSIHCLVSWFCYIGLRGKKEVPAWYRGASCVMAVLVCISTLTTKQHVVVDVAGGILLAEACFWIGKHPKIWRAYERLWDKVNWKVFRIGDGKCG